MTAHATTWPEVFHEQYGFVHSVSRRLAGPDMDPDDLAQDVFVVVHRRLHSLRESERLRSWLYGICRRVVAAQRRKKVLRATLRSLWGNPEPQAHPTPEAEAMGLETERHLYAAIDRLSAKRREALILYALEEMSGKEIAELLEIPEATVWTRVHAARKQLVALLSEPGGRHPLKEELLTWDA